MIENCPMRHKENGNCIPVGGFCTANKNICYAMRCIMRIRWAQNLNQSAVIGLREIYVRVGVISGSVLFVGRNVLPIQISVHVAAQK